MKQSNWTKEKPYCIYRHTSPSGGVYIGKTQCKNLYGRWGENGKKYFDAPIFWKAIQKYGWGNIKHEILFEGLTKAEAATIERREIAKYKNTGASYNIASGGEGGCGPMSAETRAKISAANKGRKVTNEQKELMRARMQNMTHMTNGTNNIDVYDEQTRVHYEQMGYWVGRTLQITEDRRNRVWLNNGVRNQLITESNISELRAYLENGYKYGMIQTSHQTEEERKLSNKAKGRPQSKHMRLQKSVAMKSYGYKWMNDGLSNIRVPKSEHKKYLENGWIFGRLTKHDERGRYIHM